MILFFLVLLDLILNLQKPDGKCGAQFLHSDDDEQTELNNEDQADNAEKNDEDKAEEEKDIDQERIQDEQAKDEESTDAKITSMVDVLIQQKIPPVLSAPLLDVLASVVPLTPTNPTPPPIQTTTITTTTEAPSSTTAIPDSKTLSALRLRLSDLEKKSKNSNKLISLK
ncbi:hypothetical protein Tco_0177975 [Tanacetum coccineum]